jgi:hypothetical protein
MTLLIEQPDGIWRSEAREDEIGITCGAESVAIMARVFGYVPVPMWATTRADIDGAFEVFVKWREHEQDK